MKKISIVSLIVVTAFSIYGCAKTEAEKYPVIIKDNVSNVISSLLSDSTDTQKPMFMEDKMKNPTDETMSEVSELTEGALQDDTDNADENSDKAVVITIELEGMSEVIMGKLFQSPSGYSLIYDVERFKLTSESGLDSFMANNPDPELYPYVYFNINRIDNASYDDYVKQTNDLLSSKDLSVEQYDNATVGNYDAVHFVTKTGNEWNSVVKNIYLIKSSNTIYFVETQYFLEAAEGFGARMHAMLDTFKIL